ncbi:hypothetical protein [uncultured Tenacibaculum sp.]|uniref:hypothetical protein n=1 Tax=uncultured Tenacibaculum sp. TaxID=174713 RepID=UPI002602309A|nr:hypothetical protein [uncultured Tenacibaculum sp.]
MLKNISNLGTALNKSAQQSISGGFQEPLDCSATPVYSNGYCYICGVEYPANKC